MERERTNYWPSIRESERLPGIERKRLMHLRENARIMHPGPIDRDVKLLSRAEERAVLDQAAKALEGNEAAFSPRPDGDDESEDTY